MPALIYRDAHIQDLKTIVDIYNSTVEGRMVTADTEPVTVESRIDWFHQHVAGKRPLWVVEAGPEVAGWVSFQDFYGRPAYAATAEISIYLHPQQRGRGVGKQVLADAMQRCPLLGITNLVAYIFAHNTPSLALFYKAGFKDWGLLPDIAELDGIKRSVKILGRVV